MQRTEFFVENQLFRLTNFIHFSIRSDFPRGKENVETFSLFVSYPLKQPNGTRVKQFLLNKNITKYFKIQYLNAINALAKICNMEFQKQNITYAIENHSSLITLDC